MERCIEGELDILLQANSLKDYLMGYKILGF